MLELDCFDMLEVGLAMASTERETGLVEVMVRRLEEQRIPRALELNAKLDRGEGLNDFDLDFLEEALEDATRTMAFIDKHPEWQGLAARLINLYKEITTKALAHERPAP